jgi:hypothetical protein
MITIKFNQSYFCTIILSTIILLLSGCQKDPFGTIPVTGTVQLDGKPIEGVTVSLIPVSEINLGAYGMTIADGSFVTTTAGAKFGTGVQPGEYNVTFSKTDVEEKYKPKTYSNENSDNNSADDTFIIPPLIYIVPEHYGNVNTSGIDTIKIEKGKKNHFDFNLQSK